MNTHRYLIPASLAATVHVALFWLTPEGARPDLIKVIEVPLPPWEKKLDEPPVVDEPEIREPSTEPVKPLAGGPSLPVLDEPVVMSVKSEFSMPVPERPKGPVTNFGDIPVISGPGGPVGPRSLGDAGIILAGALDRTPNAKVQMPPDYPAAMRNSGTSGSVVVEFDVNAEGRVTRAEALRYSDREFVEPALRAVKKWRFEPGRRDGRTVPFRMTVPIEFGIESS